MVFLVFGLADSVSAKTMDPTCFWQIPRSVLERAERTNKDNLDTLLREAEAGDTNAEMAVAVIYMEEKAFPADLNKADYWANRAAAKGGRSAKELKGLLAYIRLGKEMEQRPDKKVDGSLEEQLAQTRQLAEMGWMFGQWMHAETVKAFGKPKDAMPWYEKAAAQGCMDARTKLSHYHEDKPNLNRIEAYKWISLADYSRPPDESQRRDYDYDEKRVRGGQARLRRLMKPEEIEKGEELATQWAKLHGEPYTRRNWPDEHIAYVHDKSLAEAIAKSKGYLVVHFSSFDDNCKPCIESNTSINTLSQRHHAAVAFARINREPWWEKSPILSTQYNVKGLPTTVLYHNGKEQHRWVGKKIDNLDEQLTKCCKVGTREGR